jgi:hypothetical protein
MVPKCNDDTVSRGRGNRKKLFLHKYISRPATCQQLHPSTATVSDLDLCTFHDHRHLTSSFGKLQHLGKPCRGLVDIIINRVFIG